MRSDWDIEILGKKITSKVAPAGFVNGKVVTNKYFHPKEIQIEEIAKKFFKTRGIYCVSMRGQAIVRKDEQYMDLTYEYESINKNVQTNCYIIKGDFRNASVYEKLVIFDPYFRGKFHLKKVYYVTTSVNLIHTDVDLLEVEKILGL